MMRQYCHMTVSFLMLATLLASCIYENSPFTPRLSDSKIKGAPVPPPARTSMEGIYKITKGSSLFGPYAVLKWHGKDLSLFTEKQGCYFVMNAAHVDSVIYLEGYWRYSTNNNTGLVSLKITKNKGGEKILKGTPGSVVMEGAYGMEAGLPSNELIMEYERPFSQKVKSTNFYIMGHRSGGRNSDNLPVSENSIDMIRYTRNFGNNGIEIDIRLTKDHVPIVYHDPDINIRSTTKGPLNGPVGNYTWDQISTYVRLIHGERITKLEDALTFVVDSTELRAVWLDMKGDANAMSIVIPLQQKALARARQKNHPLEIWVGLPTQQVINDFLTYPGYTTIMSLCELELDDVRKTNASVWSPRWTLGTQLDKVREMHAEGRKVFSWTIDDQTFIKKFIQEGEFDGLLSNYSASTSYYFYMQE